MAGQIQIARYSPSNLVNTKFGGCQVLGILVLVGFDAFGGEIWHTFWLDLLYLVYLGLLYFL